MKLEVHLSEGCNLGCAYCSHFSPLAEQEFLSPVSYEQSLSSIDKKILSAFRSIHLLGGEPLLNKDVTEIMHITRKYYSGDIFIVTNGVLLERMPESFYQSCIDNSVRIMVSRYPIKFNYDKVIGEITEKYDGLCVGCYHKVSSFRKILLDMEGKQDIRKNYARCVHPNKFHCLQLVGTRLYACVQGAYIRHFNKAFGYDLSDEEYIDLSKVKDMKEIEAWYASPKEFCKYCILGAGKIPWRRHEKGENEYVRQKHCVP